MRKNVRGRFLTAAGSALALLSGLAAGPLPAPATEWCGENGVIRFSFAAGDSLVPVAQAQPGPDGMTRVDLYAWLTDVADVARDGEALLAIGAFELTLRIEGAEAVILAQEFSAQGLNVGRAPGVVAFGLTEGQALRGGRAPLLHWQLMFPGPARNVRIGLDPAGLTSCAKLPGCAQSGTQALYVGAAASNMLNMMFGAGCEPAWLNPEGSPDLSVVRGTSGWRDVGLFQPR